MTRALVHLQFCIAAQPGERAPAPQQLVHYLRDLANEFHTYYNAHTFIVEDAALRDARLALITATRAVIAGGLAIIGVSAPDSM